jgi:molybdopterin/thiamine biosynthesis adenylyltransferase
MKTIIVCGGGALGSHVLWLGRNLKVNWIVIDDDRVETKNLGSQWFVKQMLGKQKAQALKAQMQNFAGSKIEAHAVRLRANNVDALLARADLVVDCFDNAASRHLVQNFVREQGIPCLHGGLAADGTFGAVRWDARFVIDSEDVPGQATCEAGGFLPLIVRVSACLVDAIQNWLAEECEQNWNVSRNSSESF